MAQKTFKRGGRGEFKKGCFQGIVGSLLGHLGGLGVCAWPPSHQPIGGAYKAVVRLTPTSRSNAQHGFFSAPKYLAPCQPLVTVILPLLLGNIVSYSANHPPPIGSFASGIGSIFPHPSVGPTVVSRLQPFIGSIAPDIGSVLPNRSVGALHPTVVSSLRLVLGRIASDIVSIFGADFGCARPV